MIENRLVGIKSREIYEVPGALALITAHKELEDLVLTRDLIHFKRTIEGKLADMIYEGQWFDPLTDACKAFLFSSQERVSGTIRLYFYKGTCTPEGRKSPWTLYNYKLATYSKEDEFSHDGGRRLHRALGPADRDVGAGRQGDGRDGGLKAGTAGLRRAVRAAPARCRPRPGRSASDDERGAAMTKARSGRFGGERAPEFVRLNSSLSLDWRLWPEDIEGSVAHAGALARAGVLTAAELKAIEKGLAQVGREIEAGEFVPTDADEDVHMAVERRLTEIVGDAGAKLHTGRSRNDQVVTDVRLHLRRVIEGQREALRALQAVLVERAEPHTSRR